MYIYSIYILHVGSVYEGAGFFCCSYFNCERQRGEACRSKQASHTTSLECAVSRSGGAWGAQVTMGSQKQTSKKLQQTIATDNCNKHYRYTVLIYYGNYRACDTRCKCPQPTAHCAHSACPQLTALTALRRHPPPPNKWICTHSSAQRSTEEERGMPRFSAISLRTWWLVSWFVVGWSVCWLVEYSMLP